MKTLLTKAQAWRLIAQRIEDGKWGHRGLCLEVCRLLGQSLIDGEMSGDMQDDVDAHLKLQADRSHEEIEDAYDDGSLMYFDSPGVESTRILAALFLAEEAEDEERNAPRIVVDEWRGDTHHVRVEIRAE